MVIMYRFSKNVSLSKFEEFANNFTKFVEFTNNFMKFMWDSQITFMKFVEAANNFTKFMGLANNLWKVHNTRKNFMTFVDWKVRFKCLKVFLYLLSFTCLNILTGKHKCFINTFHK